MRKVLDLLTVYVVISALGMFFYENIYDIAFGQYGIIGYSVPMITILMILSSIFYLFHREIFTSNWRELLKINHRLYWISVVPYFLITLYSLVKKNYDLDMISFGFFSFVLCIVLLEEFVFRRVTLIELQKLYGTIRGILGSAFIFAVFHAMSFLSDGPSNQMPVALIIAFFTGISYSCTYLYTKSIGLLVLKRSFLNYMSLSTTIYPIPLLVAIITFETIMCFLMLSKIGAFPYKALENILKKLSI